MSQTLMVSTNINGPHNVVNNQSNINGPLNVDNNQRLMVPSTLITIKD